MDTPLVAPTPQPLYRQVEEILVGRIARGEWPPGTLLPAEPKIAAELGVSPGTVRKALDAMAADRLVERRQGRGTFVAVTTSGDKLFRFFKIVDAERRRVMPDCREIGREIGAASAEERRVLRLGRGARVVRVRRIRSLAGTDIMVEREVLPLQRFAALASDPTPLPTTLYDVFEARFGVTIRQASELLRAVAASAEEAHLLGLPEGAPLLEIDRTAFTFDDEPVEWRLSRLDCRHAGYLTQLG